MRSRGIVTAGRPRQRLHPVGGLLVGIRLHQVRGLVEFGFFFLELSEAKTRHRLRRLALPHGDVLTPLVVLTHQDTGGRHLHALRNAERHIVGLVLPEGSVRIPVVACDREVVTAALVHHRLFSSIRGCDCVPVADGQGLGQNHGEVWIVILTFLDEKEGLAVPGSNIVDAQAREKIEGDHPETAHS